jgi:hypothetical protein
MPNLQHLAGAQELKQAWPIIEANDQALNTELARHDTIINALQSGDSSAAANAARLSTPYGVTYPTLKDRVDATDTKALRIIHQQNKLDYKSVSVTVRPTTPIPAVTCTHLVYQGSEAVMVIMCSVTSATDTTIVMMSDSLVIAEINKFASYGIKIDMLKPHIGIAYSDTFDRSTYNPTDYNAAFASWKTALLHYASMCNTYNIPVLSVTCEQTLMEVNAYSAKWQDIYNSIKALYPNLKIVHSRTVTSFLGTDSDMYQYCDLIGVNVYLNYSSKVFDGSNITVTDVCKGIYRDQKARTVIRRMFDLAKKYNKDIFITEIGIMPKVDGLTTVVVSGATNYVIQGIFYEAVFSVLGNTGVVRGVSIWHADSPFNFFVDGSTLDGEEVIKKYYLGGIL